MVSETVVLTLNITDDDVIEANISDFIIAFGSGNDLGIFTISGNEVLANGSMIDCESDTASRQYELQVTVQDRPLAGVQTTNTGTAFLFINVSVAK